MSEQNLSQAEQNADDMAENELWWCSVRVVTQHKASLATQEVALLKGVVAVLSSYRLLA